MILRMALEDHYMEGIIFKNNTLIIFEEKSKPSEIIITKFLNETFDNGDYPYFIKCNKKGRFFFDHIMNMWPSYLKYYYPNEKAIDSRDGIVKEIIIPKD